MSHLSIRGAKAATATAIATLILLATTTGCPRKSPPPASTALARNTSPAIIYLPGPDWLPIPRADKFFEVTTQQTEELSLAQLAERHGMTAETVRDTLYILADDGIQFAPSEFASSTGPGVNGEVNIYLTMAPGSADALKAWTTRYVNSQIAVSVDGGIRTLANLMSPVQAMIIPCSTQTEADSLIAILKDNPVVVWHSIRPGERADEPQMRAKLHEDLSK